MKTICLKIFKIALVKLLMKLKSLAAKLGTTITMPVVSIDKLGIWEVISLKKIPRLLPNWKRLIEHL